ncbi:uncharacterized protein LOC117646842 [Thrips palmi]|uniref:Uncharacterized protein LOC117646842 n=1 Tax=Thrips palmi TaxID=161013 RepID=A0A6P8ZPF0_THRPL|nr:uncharacterized protein LOC117646842 [Thrips palmi]
MDDTKLKQKCQVVLVDCFKGFGPVLDNYAEEQSPTNHPKLPSDGQCASNLNTFGQDSLISGGNKGVETNNSIICDKNQSQVVLKSIYKNPNGEKKIRTTRSFERVPTSMIPQHHENHHLDKLDKNKQHKIKISNINVNTRDSGGCLGVPKNGTLPRSSTNNLDCKGGNPHEPASTDELLLDPKTGKLYKPVASTNEFILEPKDRKVSKAAALANHSLVGQEDRKMSKPATSTKDLILDPKQKKPCNTVGSADELVLDPKEGTLCTNPSYPMPSVGLTVNAGIGHPLPSLSAKCVLTCLDECKNLLTSEYAEFCSAVVKSSPLQKNKRLILPIKDDRILQLMQIKWNSKSSVKQVSLPDSLNSNVLTDNHSTKSENHSEFSLSGSLNAASSTAKLTAEPGKDSQVNENCENKQLGNQTAPHPVTKRKYVKKKWPARDQSDGSNFSSGSEWVSSRKRTRLSLLNDDKKKVSSLETGISNQNIPGMNLPSVDSEKSVQSHTKTLTNPLDSDDDEMRTVTKKTAFEILEAPYDPDDIRGINKSEEKVVKPKEITHGKASSHVLHELRRLNVAVFDMPASLESVVCGTPDICRLGCVCSSLFSRVVRDNCGLEKCMFGCSCLKTPSINRGNQSYTWVQNKAKQNLAKEERFFKQTVVRSGKDDLILVEGKRKREIKMPKKYSDDYLSFSDVKQSKASKDWLCPGEEIPNNVGSHSKQAKRVKPAVPSSTNDENPPNPSTDKEPTSEPSNPVLHDSARTAFYDYKSSNLFQYKQEQLQSDESAEKIDAGSELFKITSIQSLDQNDWEDFGIDNSADSVALPSCSYLFDVNCVKKSPGQVHILAWDALYNDIVSETVFVWYQPCQPKPNVYLTNTPNAPSYDCLNLHQIDVGSEAFKSFPNHLKALKTGWMPGPTTVNDVCWVVIFQGSNWMIVGYIRRKQPYGLSEQVEEAEKTCHSGEVDILPSIDEDYPSRWWVMDLSQNFDLVYFMDSKKALTKRQMKTLLRLSNEYSESENKVHRILLNRQRPNINDAPTSCPDFGAYSISNHPNKVFIGPYHSFNEPKFQVYSQKAAPNGKIQFLCVPLFYCGDEECVRVTSQGVLSLHSESLPDDHVKGFWYQSCGNNLRESSEKPQLADTSSEIKSSDGGSSGDLMEVEEDEESSSDISVGDHNNDKLPEDTSVSVLQNVDSVSPSSESVVSSQDSSDDDESDIQSDIEGGEPRLVYMVPNDSNIGYVTLTYLPGGAISVPHFTETASLKFYHHRSEVVNELNRLIHRKLSCLSRKCSVFLKDDDLCTCVHWSFTKKNPNCDEPKFTPEIFNGFFMLTNYGLLDLRSAEESIVQKLGKDWVEWMKNDQIRLKLQHWKSKEEQEVLEKKLKTILSANQDLPLLEVLSKATDEIAKLKAEDQLLDYESQSQKMLKETLISSLCRKLEGIPVEVVPQFLEHLEFSLLWEVLECMNNRKTVLISVSKSASQMNGKTNVKKRRGKKKMRPKNVNSKLAPKAAPKPQISSPRRRALQYMERLREEIRQEEMQKLKTQGKNPQTSQKKLQVPPKTLQKVQEPISLLKTSRNQVASLESSPSSSSTNDGLQFKEGLACRMAPFSRINICVEEGGIKHLPVMSPPLMKSPKGSPEKPNILRKSKPTSVGVTSPVRLQAQKQARKQVFQNKLEEPLYHENSVTNMPDSSATPVDSDFDPISSLRIASVVSQATSASSQDPDELNPLELSSTVCQGPVETSVANCVDPVSSLRIANVFSTRDVFKTSPQANDFSSSHLHSDPVSSLRISSARSDAISSISSSLSASLATGDLSTPFLKSNGPVPLIKSAKIISGSVISRSMAGSSQNTGQAVSKPTTTLFNNFIVCSKNNEKQVKGVVPNTFNLLSGKSISADKKLKTVHVMKDNAFITFHSKVPTSNVWNQSILSKASNSLPLIKNQHNSEGASASK